MEWKRLWTTFFLKILGLFWFFFNFLNDFDTCSKSLWHLLHFGIWEGPMTHDHWIGQNTTVFCHVRPPYITTEWPSFFPSIMMALIKTWLKLHTTGQASTRGWQDMDPEPRVGGIWLKKSDPHQFDGGSGQQCACCKFRWFYIKWLCPSENAHTIYKQQCQTLQGEFHVGVCTVP